MSRMHYIAVNRELPIGPRGRTEPKQIGMSIEDLKKTKACAPIEELIKSGILIPEKVTVYNSFEDLACINIQNLGAQDEVVKKHFKNKYVYRLFGSFRFSEKLKKFSSQDYLGNKKCVNLLINLIKENVSDNEYVEVYTCWADEEGEERDISLDKEIDLKNFSTEQEFEFKEREYVKFKG
jgi:hypothetical protein